MLESKFISNGQVSIFKKNTLKSECIVVNIVEDCMYTSDDRLHSQIISHGELQTLSGDVTDNQVRSSKPLDTNFVREIL